MWENLKQGDKVKAGADNIREVLGVCGKVYMLSKNNEFDKYGTSWTIQEMEDMGWEPLDKP